MESLKESDARSRLLRPAPLSSNGYPLIPRIATGIRGIGGYVPEKVLTNYDLEQMVDTTHDWIVSRTGIEERRIAGPHEATSDMAIAAARAALADAGLKGHEIDLVIVATVTPDHPFPAVANLIQDAIGAPRSAAFDLAAGCSGFIYAMVTASQFIATGGYRRVLVAGAETLSRIVDWKDRSTCVLFGDGAGAVVLEPCPDGFGILSYDQGSDGSGAGLLYVDAGGSRFPASSETVALSRHSIRMNGPEVFKFAVRIVEETTRTSLARAGLEVSDIDCFVSHQANARIFTAAAKKLGIPPERVYSNVHRYGNTSAASIPLALAEARANGAVRRGDIVALVGFGAGLSWASAILRWQ
jgi:3-oxoacyl-[acyl-carrier-protein] synthase-3